MRKKYKGKIIPAETMYTKSKTITERSIKVLTKTFFVATKEVHKRLMNYRNTPTQNGQDPKGVDDGQKAEN